MHGDTDAQAVLASSGDGAFQHGDIAVIPTEGDQYILIIANGMIGGVQLHPADFRYIDGDPGMRGVGAGQSRLTFRWVRQNIAAAIAGAQAAGPHGSEHEVSEVLANPSFTFERDGDRRMYVGSGCIEFELFLEGGKHVLQCLAQGCFVGKKALPKGAYRFNVGGYFSGVDILAYISFIGERGVADGSPQGITGQLQLLQVECLALDMDNAGRLDIQTVVQALNGKQLGGIAKVIDAIDSVAASWADVEVEAVAVLLGIGTWLEVRRMVRHRNRVAVMKGGQVSDPVVCHG